MRSLTVLTLCLLAGWAYGASVLGRRDVHVSSPIRIARDASAHVDDSTPTSHTDPHHNGHHGNDTDDHGDDHHGNDTHHGGHHGVHVASWQFNYVKGPLVICLILIVSALCKLGFHHANFLSSIVPESCLLIILGTVVGTILHVSGADKNAFAHFSSTLFFLYLLPPIILESAYSLHDRVFIDNLGTVLIYAVIGTILNCFIIGLILYALAYGNALGPIEITPVQCFVFSSLIVAVDPVAVLAIFQEIGVNTVLYFLVFGESLLNDAVTVVLYNMMKTFNRMDTIPPGQIFLGFAAFCTTSFCGLAIGIIFGAITALLTKYTEKVRVVEPLAVLTFAYTSYIVAELFHFSGIISIIACGLVQAQYAFHNIGQKSHTTVTYFTKMMSATCDCIIFIFLGFAMVHDKHVWHAGFILSSLLLCLFVRFIVVFILTWLVNRLNRLKTIDLEEQFIMAYGGLRGAVAFSLVAMLDRKEVPHKDMFETAALAIIVFTVFIQGITIKPLVKLLRIQKSESKIVSIYEEINCHVTDHVMAGIEEILGRRGQNFVREWLDHYDDKYFKNWLQRHPQTKDDHIMELYEKIAMQLHYENVAGNCDIGSTMELYQPQVLDPTDVHTDDPEVMERMMDIRRRLSRDPMLARQKTLARQSTTLSSDDEEMSPPITPAGSRRSSRYSEDRRGSRDPRRGSIFDLLKPKKTDPDEVKKDVTVDDIRHWVVKNPKDFHKKYDKNITNEDRSDLLHHLYEKQRRTARLRRASLAPYSPGSSLAGSMEHLPVSRLHPPRRESHEHSPVADLPREKPRLKKAHTLDMSGGYLPPPRPLGRNSKQNRLKKSASMEPSESTVPLLAVEDADAPRTGLSSPEHHLGAICEESVDLPEKSEEKPAEPEVQSQDAPAENLSPVKEEDSPERDVSDEEAEGDKVDLVVADPVNSEPESARENPTFENNDDGNTSPSPEPKTPSPEPDHGPETVPLHRVQSNKGMLARQGHTLEQPDIDIDLDSLAEHSV